MKYIGIDFGDGTTSMSLVNTDKKDKNGVVNPPSVQNILNEGIGGDKTEIPTILAYPMRNGAVDLSREILVGSLAAYAGDGGEYDVRSNWKTKPSEPEDVPGYPFKERITDAQNFMATIWKLYQQTNGNQGSDVHVVIGAPSGWSKEDREKYADWATASGLPNVTVLSESTAASLYSRKFLKTSDDKPISDAALFNGILLVDIGSSTVDFTFSKGLKTYPPKGYPIGAKYIDGAILQYNLQRPGPDVEAAREILNRQENDEIRNLAQFYCRLLKESYFSTKARVGNSAPVRVKTRQSIALSPMVDFDIYIYDESSPGKVVSDSFWQNLLETKCDERYKILSIDGKKSAWRDAFRDALKRVKEYLGSIITQEQLTNITIVLTGGASRMDFVDQDIRSVFGERIALHAGCSNDRAYSVANGLAWAGYAREKIMAAEEPMLKTINKFMESTAIQDKIKAEILMPLAKDVTFSICTQFAKRLKEKPGTVDSVGKQKSTMMLLGHNVIREKLTGETFSREMNKLLTSLVNNPKVLATTAELQREFARVSIPIETTTAISSAGLSFAIPWERVLERWKYSLLDIFLEALSFWALLGRIVDALLRDDNTLVTIEERNKQQRALEKDPRPKNVVKEVMNAFCANSEDGESKTLLQMVTIVITDAMVKTKKNELDALAGQFNEE